MKVISYGTIKTTRQDKLYYFTNVSSQGLWIIVNCLFVVVQVQVQGVPAEYQ